MNSARRCRCGTVLAQSNAGALCAACERPLRRRGRAPEVPADFWRTDAMAAALASGDLGRILRAYRLHPFHGSKPLAQAVLAGWLHVSQSTVGRIEHGQCRLSVDDLHWFAGALGLSVALRWKPTHEAGEDVDPLSRRSLLGAGAGAAFGLGATTAPAASREIDPELVDHWTLLLRVLDRHGGAFGSHEVLGTVRRELGLIAAHRQDTRGALRNQLLRVEARWAEFASWLSNDIGDLAHRDYWGDRALRLAREANYADMVAWVLLRQSQWALEQRSAQAIAFAQAAGRTPGATDHVRGLCALREAHGYALANNPGACERSLGAAHALLDTGAAEPPELGRQYVIPSYVMAAEARCWLVLRPHAAITMLENALRRWPRERTRRRGTEQARLALACAAANEPERAAAEGLKALDIARSTRSNTTVRALERVERELDACDTPAVTNFREALTTL